MKITVWMKAGDSRADEWVEWLTGRADVSVLRFAPLYRGDALCLTNWRSTEAADVLFSYRCPVIVPEEVLARVPTALNFHPGTPDYPGIGATNFALYEGAKRFGVTCHHMTPKVDSGCVVAVRVFPITASDTLVSLTKRTHAYLLALAYEISDKVLAGEHLAGIGWQWMRKPFTRHALDQLCQVDLSSMDETEIMRRVRATDYPGYPRAEMPQAVWRAGKERC